MYCNVPNNYQPKMLNKFVSKIHFFFCTSCGTTQNLFQNYKIVGIVVKKKIKIRIFKTFTTLIWVKILLSARAENMCILTFPCYLNFFLQGGIEFSFTLKDELRSAHIWNAFQRYQDSIDYAFIVYLYVVYLQYQIGKIMYMEIKKKERII